MDYSWDGVYQDIKLDIGDVGNDKTLQIEIKTCIMLQVTFLICPIPEQENVYGLEHGIDNI